MTPRDVRSYRLDDSTGTGDGFPPAHNPLRLRFTHGVRRESGSMTRIMLVDADTIARRRIRRVLEHKGDLHVVAEAGSAGGAINSLDAAHPDVLLMSAAARGVSEIGVGGRAYARLASIPAVLM